MSELRVALTFDAEHPSREGNAPGTEEAILDALAAADIRATFFVQGRWATAHPSLARRIRADGHLVGSHSHWHAPLTLLSEAGVRVDVAKAERRIIDVMGVDPKPWFRCPFGDGADQPRVIAVLASVGYRNVHWNVDTEDWCEERSPADVHEAAVEGVRAAAGNAVVLLHTWSAQTAHELPAIIDELRADGATFGPIKEVFVGP